MPDNSKSKSKGKRQRSYIDPNESKLDRFHRVAESRVRKALKAIRVVTACTNTARYEWTPEDVDRIQAAFSDELEVLASGLAGGKSKASDFTFRR